MNASAPATFTDLLHISTPEMHPIALRLREIILSLDPAIIEDIRLTDRAACYGLPAESAARFFCYIFPCTRWVHLGFYRGIHLPDPTGLLIGTGKELRYVKVHTLKEAGKTALHALLLSSLSV